MNGLYKLIIADDEAIIREGMASYEWERLGFTVIGTASSGRKVLDIMEREPADLIITDIRMPVMDGLEATRQIRLHSHLQDVPIIAISAHVLPEHQEKFIEAGMNGYLTKPITQKSLTQEILRCLHLQNE